MLGISPRETPTDAAYAARNGATFLEPSAPDERDTRAAYPISNVPTYIFIDRDGVIRSIVLEDMDTGQAADAESDVADYSMQSIRMHTPPGGVQIPQLSLQQT